MGLLSKGTPLSWEETKKNAWIVHKIGIEQFIALYHKLKDRKGDTLKWGDEVEYTLVHFDDKNQATRLNLDGPKILTILRQPEIDNPDDVVSKWSPEYSSYMIEGTPGTNPYGGCYGDFNFVEANMRIRREQMYEVLQGTQTAPLCIATFPRLLSPGYTEPYFPPQPETSASRSLFCPDEAICYGHPRFKTLTRNIRERRGEKVAINLPIYKDKNTPSPFIDQVPNDDGSLAKYGKPDHIYLDCMQAGMGCACLQVTFQACDIHEARHLYDHLYVMCPILLAISAGSPMYRGYLVDIDCRYDVIADAVDDRTAEERGLKPLKNDKYVIPQSRYGYVDLYLASDEYNDTEVPYNETAYKTLRDNGIDHLLAKHVAHLFIRDPVSLFEEMLDQDVENHSDHFENIQSTNWQTMRFKPPPPNSTIGWRVEFRPLDLQITDFENAAFVVFVALLTRAILSFKLNFYIPISKVQENLKNSQVRDALHRQKFYFRKSLVPEDEEEEPNDGEQAAKMAAVGDAKFHEDEYTLMDIDTIMNGKGEFPGVIPLVRMYVNSIDIDVDTRCTIMQYLRLISKRASGELMTTASWMRQFVTNHPEYKHDSVVNDKINYDLMSKIRDLSEGKCTCPELTGKIVSRASLNRVPCPEPSVIKTEGAGQESKP